jgi:hypothetical protein
MTAATGYALLQKDEYANQSVLVRRYPHSDFERRPQEERH